MPLYKGMTLDNRYIVTRALGAGGMGAAYLVEDQQMGRYCVIKEMLSLDAVSRNRLEYEAQLLASLHHFNLPHVYRYFFEQERPFLVMEYIEGPTLLQLHDQRSTPFETLDVLYWARGLLKALHYMHEHAPPVIHRDIKPPNICITPQGKAVLLDFGIARPLDEGRTRTVAQALTRSYAPIEQYRRSQVQNIPTVLQFLEGLRDAGIHTGPYTDIYGLGATLYFALTRLSPPDAGMRVLRDELSHPQEINSQIPDFVADAVMHALSIHPRDRFQTALQMSNALRLQTLDEDNIPQLELAPVPITIPWDKPNGPSPPEDQVGEAPSRFDPRRHLRTVIGLTQTVAMAFHRPRLVLGILASLTVLIIAVAMTMSKPGENTNQLLETAATPSQLPTFTPFPSITSAPTSTTAPTVIKTLSPTSTPLPTATPLPSTTPSPIPHFTVSADRLTVYAAPGNNYEVLGEVRRGDQLSVQGRLDNSAWWQIDYFGLEGWVPAQPAGTNIEPAALPVVTPPSLPTIIPALIVETALGQSVKGREISMTVVGNGNKMAVVMVGALDGTQISTRDLVSATIDYLSANLQDVPGHVTFYLIPSINPDGVAAGGRYNANEVDINRNWATADWISDPGEPDDLEGKPGAGGFEPFSEPETRALRDHLQELKQQGGDVLVIALHASVRLSQDSGKVFPGATSSEFHADSTDVAQRFAAGMQYNIETEWSDYTTSGELITWCAEQDITSMDVVFSDEDLASSLQVDFTRVLLEIIR